jgi:hypothetical protein
VTRVEPLVLRWTLRGAGLAGLVGGAIGLVVGLLVHPATAWFATIELGVPSLMLGALIGLTSGVIASALGRRKRPVSRRR